MKVLIAALVIIISLESLHAQARRGEPHDADTASTEKQDREGDPARPGGGEAEGNAKDPEYLRLKSIEGITITSKREMDASKKVINVEMSQPLGSTQNIMELLSGESMLDYRGTTSLVPDDDTYYLRGFSAERFATAIDGMTLRKTGGRKSSHIVDYALLPPWMIERVEILPGPHSALYPGKAIGGVINFITKTPRKHESLKPDVALSAGYGSYNTQNYNAVINGAVESFIYDLGFQRYSTSGNLRQSDAAINTLYGRIGGVFPLDGFFTASHSYSRADRSIPVNNNLLVMRRDPLALFDRDYPIVVNSEFNNWQNPTWDKVANTTRLNFFQPTPIGTIKATGYYGIENRDRRYPAYINIKNPGEGVYDASWETVFWQYGGRVEYELSYAKEHTTTAAFDFEELEDGCGRAPSYSLMAYRRKKRVEILAGALQHRWDVSRLLDITAGLRYEDVSILVSNFSTSGYNLYITGKPTWIHRHWAGIIPKSFATFKFDRIAEFMRDTSVSVGVSRIWHAPDYHGNYNPQGRPAGAWLHFEDGIGYDLIVTRRIWRDITFQARYYLYDIKNYIAHNSGFSFFSGKNAPAGFEYRDYMRNLKRVHRHGFELNLHGEILDGLSFHTSYTYQEFRHKGMSLPDRLAAKVELDGQARHLCKSGLRYLLSFTGTVFMIDYVFRSEQTYMNPLEVATDTYIFYVTRNNPYHLLDVAIAQTLIKDRYYFRDLRIKFFIKNILNDIYQDELGYQMPGRTYGGEISMKF
ncbi:MAG: TonB-dependent receptor plug domain-containing protein [Spirochaetes bacterium]|nr:TonB-dependent receptor plug domain-containing protein [Spirochaetota bacterium]